MPKWYHNIWILLFLLLFVLGPLGLPLAWKNPRLSLPAKIALTLLMAAYTVLLIKMTAKILNAILQY